MCRFARLAAGLALAARAIGVARTKRAVRLHLLLHLKSGISRISGAKSGLTCNINRSATRVAGDLWS
jgi:hypothetical protein